jgi:transcription antitermination factor NusG
MGVDMVIGDDVTVTARASGARHPECGAHPDNQGLIKLATTWGGVRVGAGAKPRPPSVVVSAGGARWYCIEVAPRTERLVAAEIARLGVVSLAPEYLGTQRVRERVGGQVKFVDRAVILPAFPGYVFAEFDAVGPEWRRIATRRGVKRLIGSDPERPLAVPPVQMAWVISQFGEDGAQRMPRQAAAPILLGAMVRVVAGPLVGLVARVVRSNGKTVSVEWSGRPVTMAQAVVEVCA